jgi:hypothetical protein
LKPIANILADDPTGPHSSHAANSADPRVDSDRYGAAGNTSGAGGIGAGQYGSNTTHTGTHTGAHTGTGLTGSHGTTHGSDPTGPHSSHMANKADPRVDSDRIGTAGNTSGAGGYGAGQYGSSNTHTTGGLTGASHNTHGSDPTGPHDSRMANKLDPRVDSDRVGPAGNSGAAAHNTPGSGLGSHNTYGTTGTGLTGSHNTHNDPTGPHSSHMANQADPRVDSDRYGAAGNTSGAGGYGAGQYGSSTGSGLTGSHGTHTGTTGTGLAGAHGTHGTHTGATVGSGNSNTTAGPHNSDMMNKLDPRVDSDLDGSKTYGGNQTYH